MLFQLDHSLLEVLFIYTIKISPKERFILFTHLTFLQFVTNLSNSSKGWAKGLGVWPLEWFILGSRRSFCFATLVGDSKWTMFFLFSSCFANIPSLLLTFSWYLCSSNVSKERWGCLVEWVEKASFARLKKLFEIDAAEWAHNVLLSNKNLQALIENPKPFIILVFSWLAVDSPFCSPSICPIRYWFRILQQFHGGPLLLV